MICGEFNSVLNNALDIISGDNHKVEEINTMFKSFIDQFDLYDLWRNFNTSVKDFMSHRKNPFIARRLDYFLGNTRTIHQVSKIEHKFISGSDHKAIFLEIETTTFDRGPGIWRFDNSLLQDEQYLKEINEFIDNFMS